MNTTATSPRFALGQILIAPQAQEQLETAELRAALCRHALGDWGEITPSEVVENERSLRDGDRVISIFRNGRDEKFCVLTNGHRSATLVATWADN